MDEMHLLGAMAANSDPMERAETRCILDQIMKIEQKCDMRNQDWHSSLI